jgi:hypothetical protein
VQRAGQPDLPGNTVALAVPLSAGRGARVPPRPGLTVAASSLPVPGAMTATERTPEGDGPPRMPEIDRRVHPHHIRDLALLTAIPLLALVGLAGPRVHEEVRAAGHLEVSVEHPALTRASRPAALHVRATNHAAEPVAALRISLPERYLSGFTLTGAMPAGGAAHELLLTELESGRSQAVRLELHAERRGVHRGAVRFESTAGDTTVVPVRTLILP